MHSSLQLVTPRGMAPALFRKATLGASLDEITSFLEITPVELGIPAAVGVNVVSQIANVTCTVNIIYSFSMGHSVLYRLIANGYTANCRVGYLVERMPL